MISGQYLATAPRKMNAEMADVVGLFAPRPVVVVAGRDDPIFPVAATRRQFRQLKSIYKAAGAADRCQLIVGPEGHRFYADLAWPKMLRQMERQAYGAAASWVPLTLSLEWVAGHPGEPPPRPGPELLREFMERLTGQTIPEPPEDPRG